MNIDQNTFVEWAEKHFDTVQVSGSEIKVPDLWWHKNDTDLKCWINIDKACFHAFKSEKTGHLIEFVMHVEGCDWDSAIDILGGENSLRYLESKLDKFLSSKPEKKDIVQYKRAALPKDTYLISSLSKSNPIRISAEQYLRKRKILPHNLMVTVGKNYSNRIVIPYYDKNGQLIYFNTRSINNSEPKYLGPPKDRFGCGKGDVVFMCHWPKVGQRVYLTEGEFDAMTLHQCGLIAAAVGGKALSEKQVALLNDYKLTIAFDSDRAGREGLEIGAILVNQGLRDTSIIRPPKGYKDWNDLFLDKGLKVLRLYIAENEQPCYWDKIRLLER